VLVAACSGSGPSDTPAPASGQLDPAYGSTGKVALPTGAYHQNVIVDAEGNAFVGAWTFDASQGYVVKLDPLGAVATAYGDGGRVVVSPGGSFMGAMTLDASGNLYSAAGDTGVMEFDPSGHRIASVVGVAPFMLPAALVRLSDATFYVAFFGSSGFTGQFSSWLGKYDRNGQPDPVLFTVAAGPPIVAADEPRGALYIASSASDTGRVSLRKFDLGTRAVTAIHGDFEAVCGGTRWAAAADVDGAGNVYFATTCGGGAAAVWKFDAHGNPVTTFGNGGSRSAVFGSVPSRIGFVRSSSSANAQECPLRNSEPMAGSSTHSACMA
jgi:hypothetical protein